MDNKQLSEIKGTLKALEECISGNVAPECLLGDKCRTVIDKARELQVGLDNDGTILNAAFDKRDAILCVLEMLEIAQFAFEHGYGKENKMPGHFFATARKVLSDVNSSWGDQK